MIGLCTFTNSYNSICVPLFKKDQDFGTLVEKLKSELLKLSDQPNEVSLTVPDLSDFNFYDQIEHLHRTLLSHVAIIQVQQQASQEQLVTKDAENHKLHSENKRLLEEIADQKCALEKSLSCEKSVDRVYESANAAAEQNICLCSKHRPYVMANVLSVGESTSVRQEIVKNCGVTEANQTSELPELGAGEFVPHHDFLCVVCEKESQLVLANEKIRSSHDRISQLEEMVSQLRLDCEPQNGCVDKISEAGNENHLETDSDERIKTALKSVEENHCLEMTCLREKIECLESQLREVSDTHRLKTDDTDRRHQMELEELQRRFDTESEQMSLRLSKELENLKEEITQLERELLRQREANELSEKSTEIIKLEMHSQKQCFETRLATIIEEKQNLEEELQMAGERNQIVSAALKDVQTLKASLVKSVQEIVKRTMQEERGVTADTENAAEIKSNEVRQNLDSERDLYAKGEEEEKEMVMKMQAGEGNILKESRLKDGGLRAGDDVEELENKNDVLHLLLHDWQGCVQMLKNCLVEKEAECHVLETDLQEAQVTMQTLRTQLVEDNEKWHSRMEETKELHRQELNYIEEEIKNRIAAKEMGLAGNDEKWQATMEEVQKSHKKELNCLQEEIKNLIAIKEAELSGNEDQWKAKIEEVKEFYKAELNHLHEEIKSLIAIKETELAGNEDIWKSKMEEVRELNKEEISRLEEDFKKQISVKEADLIGIEEKWKGTMEEVLLLHKEELIRLKEDFRNQTTTKEGEFALENEKWEARMEGVKEQYQTELNRLGEEIKSLNVTKGTELVGNDEKWRAKLEEVTMVHKEELNRFEEEIKKLIAARGLEFALDGEKWQDRLEEAKKLHTEELNRLEEEKKDLVSTKERELADLQTSLREEKDIAANETEKLRNDLVVLEDKNGQLSDQLNASEKQIENLLMTMHDLKNLKDAEEDTLRRNLQEAMQMAEKTVEDRIQSLNEQKDALQEQLQELKQDSEVQLERLRSRNEDLASELRTVKLQEDKLLEDIRELELMNKKLKMQHDHLENELKFLQEELIELKVRREEAAEGEKSLADKLWLTEEQCKAAENQIEKLKNLESTQQTKIQELLVQRDSDKEAFQGLHDENGELRNELKILKEQGNSSKKLQKALKVLKDKNESLSLHVKELEEQRNSIQTELQEIKEQHGSVCKEVEEQKSNIEKDLQEFKDKNDALIEQMKALEHEKDSLFNELQEWKDNKGSLDEQIKTLEEQRDVSQKELLEHKDRIVALCEQVKETEEQKELISRNVKELEEQLEQMQKQLQDLKDQNGILKIQLEDTEKNKQSDLQEMAQQGSRILEDADILRTEVMRLSSLTATLENQLKQSEADSVSQINKLEEELEKMKAEAEMQKEVAQQAEEKVKELRDLSEMLSMEKVRKDYEVKEVKERSAEIEAGYRLELFELRKYLCALLNPEMSLVDETEGQAEEIAVLRKVVETELSSHLLGLNTRIDMLSKQSYDVAMKADELTEQLNAAEKKRLEEELILKAKQSDLEVRNGELRSEIEKLNILVNELQDQSNGFALTQAVHDRTISEKDRLLKESEEKLKIMSQEGDLKQMKLLSNLEELQGKVTMLSDQSTENEKIASASQQRLSELAESLTKSESCLREAEEKLDTLSAEHETERKRLMAIIEELSNKSAEGATISEENALLLKSMEERLKHDADEHERLFTNLKLDFDALQEDLSTKTEQVIEFENTLAEKDLRLKEVEENLTGKITDSEREIERLHDRVKELEDLMTHTEGNVQETVRKINESKALELEEKTQNLEKLYKIKVEHLEGVILSHENRVETLTESLLVFEKTKETLEAENDQLKLRVAEQLQNISATHDDMLKKLDVAYCECKNKDADILELRKTSEERGKILGELQEILTVKEQEIEKMRLQLSDAEGKIQLSLASEELIAELQDRVKIESEEHKSQVDRLETENETQRNELSRVISENEVARSEIDRLKVEIGEHRRETNSLQIKNEESLSEFNGLKVKYDEHESEISILQAENKELNTEINRLNDKIMDLERERSDLFLEKTKAIEEKDAAWKGLEEKLLERSELETKKDEGHRKEMEATETRLLEKIKELQRKFVIKLKAVQNENEKLVRGVNTENEELRLSKSGLEMQLDNIRKVADERLRTADELQFRLSELQKCQADAVQKTDECVVEKHHEDLMKKSHEVLAEQTKVELAVNSHKGAEELSDQQQVHENSSCDASVEKQQLENSVLEIRNQLEQALSVANEAQLKMEKSEKIVLELNESIDMLKNEIDELKVKNAEELRVQTERLEAECSEKLGELKKKAEMRLKQIKNQIQTERDASIAEVIKVRDNLTEQLSTANGELLRQTELLREKEEEIQRLKNSEDKQIEETCSLREALEASKQQLREDLHAKDNILEELKGRHQSLEDEAERLRQTIVGLKEEDQLRSDKLTTLETNCKGLKKQLVSAKREIDRINSEKDVEVRAAQLDKETEVARLMSEYKEQLKDLEIDNNSRIKQLVKEFQQKLAEKENEFQSTYMESVGEYQDLITY